MQTRSSILDDRQMFSGQIHRGVCEKRAFSPTPRLIRFLAACSLSFLVAATTAVSVRFFPTIRELIEALLTG
jgi:hypothetical protein